MTRFQLAVRIPRFLHEQLNSYIDNTGASKTDVVVGALAYYLDCIEDLPISHRLSELEARLAAVEEKIKSN